MKEIYIYSHLDNLPLALSFYPSTNKKTGMTLLYFHGGGLIYGNRDDLPADYISMLNAEGYHLLSIDYPLAPEVSIKVILKCLQQAINWFKTEYQDTLGITTASYCLFGRSAGAYLALLIGSQLSDADLKGIISFYGYYALTESDFNEPSSYYQKYPTIPFMTLHQLTLGAPKSQASINERFVIYLAYRQSGNWAKQLVGSDSLADYNVTHERLQCLPPTFIAASTGDQDVPYRISEKMAVLIDKARLFKVKGLPHDFDSDSQQVAAQDAYRDLLAWLDLLA